MVADQHRGAGRPGLLEAAAAVGQHDGPAAGAPPRCGRRARRRRRPCPRRSGCGSGRPAGCCRRSGRCGSCRECPATAAAREAGQVGGGDLGGGLAEGVDGGQPARAEDQGDVVASRRRSARRVGSAACSASCVGVRRSSRCTQRANVWRWRMIDHFGINCADLDRGVGVLRQGAGHPRPLAGSWTSGWPSATAPTSPTSGSARSRRGPGSGPTARSTSRSPPPTRDGPRLLRGRAGAGRRGPARAAALAGVPRPLLRRVRPRPRRQQRRGRLPHRPAGRLTPGRRAYDAGVTIIAAADGSALGNPGPAGLGVVRRRHVLGRPAAGPGAPTTRAS